MLGVQCRDWPLVSSSNDEGGCEAAWEAPVESARGVGVLASTHAAGADLRARFPLEEADMRVALVEGEDVASSASSQGHVVILRCPASTSEFGQHDAEKKPGGAVRSVVAAHVIIVLSDDHGPVTVDGLASVFDAAQCAARAAGASGEEDGQHRPPLLSAPVPCFATCVDVGGGVVHLQIDAVDAADEL